MRPKLSQPATPISLARKRIPIQEWRDIIRHETWNYVQAGGKYKTIAAQTGLGYGTISKISQGETLFPRFETVIAVLGFFGYNLYMGKD